MAFEQFVRLAFVERDLFSHTVHYVPGNHDHHMWESARESQYAAYIARQPAGARINPPWHGTPMFAALDAGTRDRRRVEAAILQTVMRRYPGLADASVRVHYPSFGIRQGGNKAVIFNHGHYIDSLYSLMSHIKASLFPGSEPALTPWGIESENFAWIDFFWSTLGRSGDWGADVTMLYDMLQDERAVRVLADNLAGAAINARRFQVVPGPLRRRIASLAAARVAGRVARLERHAPGPDPLSDAGRRGLRSYVSGPVRLQIERECSGAVPDRVTFAFGHTHKPYTSTEPFDGFAKPIDLYNTGGWVVDSLVASPIQGAAAVLVDEDLNCAALHFFDEDDLDGVTAVSVRTAPGSADNPLASRLEAGIDPGAEPWSGFSSRIRPAIRARRAALEGMIAAGVADAKKRPG